jgi:hypothetical protein
MDATFDSADAAAIEVRTDSEGWLSNTPWWLISAGVHLVFLLIATLVTVERLMAVETPVIDVVMRPASPGQVLPELPRDTFTRAGLPSEEPASHTDEPAFFDPTAAVADKAESNDDDDHRQRKGDSYDSLGYIWGNKGRIGTQLGKGPGVNDRIGVGGGQGRPGRYGGPFGGRDNTRPPGGGTKARGPAEDAVLAALKWLARHQNPDGSWGAANHVNHCVGAKCAGVGDAEFDAGLTGLAILAYLGAGYTHLSKDEHDDAMNPGRKLRFGDVVKSGLKWLMSKQDPEGCIGGRGTKYMYNHTIAALALSEAYGMSATQLFKGPAQQAIDFVIAAQNPDRAWRYTKQCGDNDTSVTGWAVMALKSAELSELSVPSSGYEKARKWLDEATEPHGYYRVGYNARGSGKVFVPGKNESYVHHESMTAVGVLCRIFMTKNKKDPALGGVALLVADLPESKQDVTDYYYWYYGSLALFQYDGPNGPYWKKWESAMKNALVPHQKTGKDGCANGSWTSEDERWGFEGGRVYATAINALTLEVYYRYPNVFRGEK